MKLQEIRNLAEGFVKRIKPWCERVKIAGSIRREKAEPRDIEIVCIPKETSNKNLFGEEISRRNKLFAQLKFWQRTDRDFDIVKGSGDCPKYVQLQGHNGPKIDIFFATPENWGWILFLRTGPKEWNIRAVQTLAKKSYTFGDGYIQKQWKPVDITTEKAIFKLLGWNWIEPRNRT